MLRTKTFNLCALLLLITLGGAATAAAAQKEKAGGIKGKVRADEGHSASDVRVTIKQGEREVARGETDRKGNFEIKDLAPGRYAVMFRKPGLSVAELKDVEVEAGKVRTIKGGSVFLPVDEGTLAILRGSVFNAEGRSLPGARIELMRVGADGTLKKIDGRISNETGSFAFRLLPDAARYRVTAKMDGMQATTQEVSVEGAAIYRVALNLKPSVSQQ
ncbi:MAG: carboxypeptidase regulatory-like domain-containing protein [Pyrinomonadaceae bacterium]